MIAGPAPERGGRAAGFTLLEVLIAFVIAAIALSVLFSGSLNGLIAVQAATGYEQAVSRARSRLDAESVGLTPGDREGDDGGGFHWRVRVSPVETFEGRPRADEAAPPSPEGARAGVTLYAIDVAVSWSAGGRTRVVQLASERLGVSARAIR